MVQINFVGDFKCDNIANLKFEESLKNCLSSSNLNVINFEAPVKSDKSCAIKKSGPHLSNNSLAPSILMKVGFGLFSLANNHIKDWGEDGIKNTINSFPHDSTCGAGAWNQAYSPVIKQIGDYKVGFISVSHHEFGVLYDEVYNSEDYGCAWMLHPIVDEIILKTKKEVDYLFLLPHCGMEHEYYPMPEVVTLYRHWIRLGADGVMASHPHTPQPWEMYEGKPIVYSMGNFCFDALENTPPQYWYWGLIVSVNIEKCISIQVQYVHYNQDDDTICIENEDALFNSHMNKILNVFCNEEEYVKNMNVQCNKYASLFKINDLSFYYYLKKIVKKILGRSENDEITTLNRLRCESHRWAILRILENKITHSL